MKTAKTKKKKKYICTLDIAELYMSELPNKTAKKNRSKDFFLLTFILDVFLVYFSILLQKSAFQCPKWLGRYIFDNIYLSISWSTEFTMTTTPQVYNFSPNRPYCSYATNTKSFPVPFREWNSESPFIGILQHSLRSAAILAY